MWTAWCRTPEETFALGQALGRRAFPGTVVALDGDLGAGKTVFAKGVGAGLGVRTRVTSPTFVLLAAHEGGRLPLWHADLYRLGDGSELDALGLVEVVADAEGVVLIEWAQRFPDALPADRLEVRLEDEGEGRRITATATGPRHRAIESLGE